MTQPPPIEPTHQHRADSSDPAGIIEEGLIGGFSLDELSDYLDLGRTPHRPEIENSPEARHALTRLERIRTLSGALLTADSASAPPPDESWFQSIVRGLSREVRAGQPIPLRSPNPAVELTVSEGAVRALIRDVGDRVPGAIIERTRFEGDLATAGAPITVRINVTVYILTPLPELADQVRAEVAAALATHTELVIAGIDITIADIHTPPTSEENP